jgi:hypothetical protein
MADELVDHLELIAIPRAVRTAGAAVEEILGFPRTADEQMAASVPLQPPCVIGIDDNLTGDWLGRRSQREQQGANEPGYAQGAAEPITRSVSGN